MTAPKNLQNTLNAFLKNATWLTKMDEPSIQHLKMLAITLDKQYAAPDGVVSAPLMSLFRLTLNDLRKRESPEEIITDPGEAALRDIDM